MKRFIVIMVFTFSLLSLIACQKEPDIVPPHITGAKDITYYMGRGEPDYLNGVSANDNIDGDITSQIEVDLSEVDLETPGIYPIIYKATNKAGNTGASTCMLIVIE